MATIDELDVMFFGHSREYMSKLSLSKAKTDHIFFKAPPSKMVSKALAAMDPNQPILFVFFIEPLKEWNFLTYINGEYRGVLEQSQEDHLTQPLFSHDKEDQSWLDITREGHVDGTLSEEKAIFVAKRAIGNAGAKVGITYTLDASHHWNELCPASGLGRFVSLFNMFAVYKQHNVDPPLWALSMVTFY